MDQKTIVAIEIASSKVKGAVGATGPDGRMTVLAVEEIPATNNVRYGRIQNIREVSAAVDEIVRRLESSHAVSPRRVAGLALSLGGRSLMATTVKGALKFRQEREITESLVERLEFEAKRDYTGDRSVVLTIPRRYIVNNAAVPVRKVVGTFGETLRGEFLMLTCAKETVQNIGRLRFETVDEDNVRTIVRPVAVADLVLTPDEKELGCALVDFGAETTTVMVYKDGMPAFLSTIPMGSRLITLDLMAGLGITEEAAENLKLTVASLADSDDDSDEVKAYVRARAGEIAANIVNQIERSGFTADTLSRIVLVGGGSKLPDFGEQLTSQTKLPVRVADMPSDIVFRTAGSNRPDNIDVVALLAAASRLHGLPGLTVVKEPEVIVEDEDDDVRVVEIGDEIETVVEKPVVVDVRKRHIDDEDDSILKDDEDDEEDDDYGRSRRGGFFGLGRRKKAAKKVQPEPEPEEEEEEIYEEEEVEEEPRRQAPSEPEPDKGFGKVKGTIEAMRRSFIDIFMPPESDDENEEDSEDYK